jgi:hypothetical protein
VTLDVRNEAVPASPPDRTIDGLVDELAETAFEAMSSLVTTNGDWLGSLSWLRDARGTAALVAQLRLMAGDPAGAVAAFERGHALLLGRVMPAGTHSSHGAGSARAEATQGPGQPAQVSGQVLHVWAAPKAGGAVLTQEGRPVHWSILPALSSSSAGGCVLA